MRDTDVPIRPIGTETVGVFLHDARPVPVGKRQRRTRRFRDVALSGHRSVGYVKQRRVHPPGVS